MKCDPDENIVSPRVQLGLTKREWFAGMVLQGIMVTAFRGYVLEAVVERAVELADALIAELNKGAR